ncbi:hypothetical protein L6386_03300 [bacterium]|nr:hypothetical protein [bacterium]MCG2677570.1 hypothetical protein [bacterium]
MKTLYLIMAALILVAIKCVTTTDLPQTHPLSGPHPHLEYYHSVMLGKDIVPLGDTSVRPPVLFKEYSFRVERMPLVARLKAEIFHQGSSEFPVVRVNGRRIGTLSPHWNDLSSRKYDIIFFDKNEKYSQVLDYNDWLKADCFIFPEYLQPGENCLEIATARAGTGNADDIDLRNVEIEFRYLDREDTVTDLRRKSRNLPLPYLPLGLEEGPDPASTGPGEERHESNFH